jgi:hypothetical protein
VLLINCISCQSSQLTSSARTNLQAFLISIGKMYFQLISPRLCFVFKICGYIGCFESKACGFNQTSFNTLACPVAYPSNVDGVLHKIVCNNGDVEEIQLVLANLSGQLDLNLLAKLSKLTSLTLARAQLFGTIGKFPVLPQLRLLNLARNKFSGPLSDFNLPSLGSFRMSYKSVLVLFIFDLSTSFS